MSVRAPLLPTAGSQADDKALCRTSQPMDRLQLLLSLARRDEDIQQKHLVDTLLAIIDGLHSRICKLETAEKDENKDEEEEWSQHATHD